MNYRAIIHYAGNVLKAESLFMLAPMLISLYEREFSAVYGFVITIAVMVGISFGVNMVKRGSKNITAKDGLVLVAICWILLSFFGALPFWFSGEIPSFTNCLFESVSGFTTTGATILADVEALGGGLLFWRSFSHWIGGMGILVFLLAVVQPTTGEHTINVMKAESPGPSPGKLVPSLKQSVKIVYGMYIVLTGLQIILYLFGGMPLFDSFCNAFATAGTGGFSVRNDSFNHYNSVYIEGVTTVFMLLFGVNFNIYYFIIVKNFKTIAKNSELKAYFSIYAIAVVIITFNIYSSAFSAINTLGMAFRQASFHVASIITTTGFGITNYIDWPELSRTILMALTFTGACAGSTAGGLKISRIVIMFKEAKRVLFRMSHPRSYEVIQMDGKSVDKRVIHGVCTYIVTFSLIFWISLLLLSIENRDFITDFSSVATCINNVGPGFGMVGPMEDFSFYSVFSKIILIFDMLAGRLEIYPVLVLCAPHTWRKL